MQPPTNLQVQVPQVVHAFHHLQVPRSLPGAALGGQIDNPARFMTPCRW